MKTETLNLKNQLFIPTECKERERYLAKYIENGETQVRLQCIETQSPDYLPNTWLELPGLEYKYRVRYSFKLEKISTCYRSLKVRVVKFRLMDGTFYHAIKHRPCSETYSPLVFQVLFPEIMDAMRLFHDCQLNDFQWDEDLVPRVKRCNSISDFKRRAGKLMPSHIVNQWEQE